MITYEEIKNIKQKLGNEMARRRWYGNLNVSPYNATTMSNEAQITKGSKMLAS